jgi:hypothetical protein
MEQAHPYKDHFPSRKHCSERSTVNKTILTAGQLAKLHPISTNILRTVHTEQR